MRSRVTFLIYSDDAMAARLTSGAGMIGKNGGSDVTFCWPGTLGCAPPQGCGGPGQGVTISVKAE